MRHRLIEPSTEQILAYCDEDPVERVFLEDVARRGHGRFAALEREDGMLQALCHLGTNVVPSGRRSGAFADLAARVSPRMLIGEEAAVTELWETGRKRFGRPREDRPSQPVYVSTAPPKPGGDGTARRDESRPRRARPRLCARARGGGRRRPAAARSERVPVADAHADRGGPVVGLARGRRHPVQGRGVRLDTGGRATAAGLGRSAARRQGYASRALRDLIRQLLESVPAVCLFVRAENAPAIRLYETVGMRTLWRTGACSSEAPDPCAARARPLQPPDDRVSSVPPGEGLSDLGVEEALALRGDRPRCDRARGRDEAPPDAGDARARAPRARRRADRPPDARRDRFGSYEGGTLAEYRSWAWSNEPDALCPGGGESRVDAADRVAAALSRSSSVRRRRSSSSPALPMRYVLDASDGSFPAARIAQVPHATPFAPRRGRGRARRRDAPRLGVRASIRRPALRSPSPIPRTAHPFGRCRGSTRRDSVAPPRLGLPVRLGERRYGSRGTYMKRKELLTVVVAVFVVGILAALVGGTGV